MAWWSDTPVGTRIPVAVVGIDGVGWTKERDELPPDTIRARKEKYYARIQQVTREFGGPDAAIAGDGGILFLHFSASRDGEKPSPIDSARIGFKAAMALWQAIRADLNFQVRIAVHCATMSWDPQTGRLDDKQLDLWGHLDKDGGIPNAIVVSEDVYLALEASDREKLAFGGTTRRDRIPVYCYPAACASKADPKSVDSDPAQKMWASFRTYARTPEIAKLQYTGFRMRSASPPALDLESVFVPLDVETPERDVEPEWLEEALVRESREEKPRSPSALTEDGGPMGPWGGKFARGTHTRPRPFREAFKTGKTLVVLGDPGAGKSTLARWLALVAADGRLRMEHELGVPERLLPLPVSVGLLTKLREKHDSLSVLGALGLYFQDRNVGTRVDIEAFLKDRLENGEALLLLDGLDEVTIDREGAVSWLQSFVTQHPRNRFVITSRIVGYSGLPRFVDDPLVVRPFSDAQVERYVHVFCDAYREAELGRRDPRAKELGDELLAAIKADERLQALARNPFLLSSIALAHRAEGKLPNHRVYLYEMFLRALCETWAWARKMVVKNDGETFKYELEVVPILGYLAYRMHLEHPTGVAPRGFIVAAIEGGLKKQGKSEAEARASTEGFLERATQQAQVLIERGPSRWGFLHLTFQEFLVAKYLLYEEDFESHALERRFDPRWQEVLRLGVSAMVLLQNRGKQANALVRRVLETPAPPPREWLTTHLFRNVTVAATLGAELGEALDPSLADGLARRLLDREPIQARDVWRRLRASPIKTHALAKITHALKDHPQDDELRQWAAHMFGVIGSDEALGALFQLLKDANHGVRANAVRALGLVGSEAALDPLFDVMADRNDDVRWGVADALGKIGSPRAVEPLQRLLKDPDDTVRSQATDSLTLIAGIGPLLALLNDTDDHVRSKAVLALGRSGREEAVQPIASLLTDEHWLVRLRAIRALRQIESVSAARYLETALADPHPKVRHDAAIALAEIGAERAIEPLLVSLKDEDSNVRRMTARALGNIPSERVMEPLLALVTDPNIGVRAAAAVALSNFGSTAIDHLFDLLKNEDELIRARAVVALGATGSERAVEPLIRLLDGGNDVSRWRAAVALARIADRLEWPGVEPSGDSS